MWCVNKNKPPPTPTATPTPAPAAAVIDEQLRSKCHYIIVATTVDGAFCCNDLISVGLSGILYNV